MITPKSELPYRLYLAQDVRELDRVAIEEFGIPGLKLMMRAGTAVFRALLTMWPTARRIAVVTGAGNNAGDGFVIARLAKEKGLEVTLMALVDPDAFSAGDAKRAWGACKASGVNVQPFDAALLNDADVIVDSILGTGLDREVTGQWADAINAINQAAAPVVAVDTPSGLHADDGQVMGTAIQAQVTMTFIGLKQGLFTGVGPDYCGHVLFDALGVPDGVYEKVGGRIRRIDWTALKALLPKRRRTAHKGDSGHTLLIGGNHGMAGAIRMAAEAAARTGSGLTTVATRPEHIAAMAAVRPEIMWTGVNEASELDTFINKATVIAIGPGMGQDYWAKALLKCVNESNKPVVVDADALNLLVQAPLNYSNWVLTPHVGEAARLLNRSSDEINRDRFSAVKALQAQYGGVVVLKGAGSLICDSDGSVTLCSGGNPGMATGGMGDVLTGIIASLIAQGLSIGDAAKAGVALHAEAGDKAAAMGERGMMALDVVGELRHLVN